MSAIILDQIIEYDKSTQAWGRYGDAGLIKYHDTVVEAQVAALPPELRAWYQAQPDQARALKAACMLANEEIIPDREAYGIYSKAYTRDGLEGFYQIDARAGTCTCQDYQYHPGVACKHVLAAKYLFKAWQREHMPRSASLWDLARQAVQEHRHDPAPQPMVIWQSGQRYAMLVHERSDPNGSRMAPNDYLYLAVSGWPDMLKVAKLHYRQVDDLPQWEWTARKDEYKTWARQVQEVSHARQ